MSMPSTPDVFASPLQLFDALPAHIEAALRESIQRFGVLVPVVRDQSGRTIDGHHRARLADELGVKYRVDVLAVADEDEAREIARTLNADRRQLTPQQRQEVAAFLRERGHSTTAIAEALNVSDETVRRDLSGSTHVEPERVVGKDGKSYPAKRPAIVAAKNQAEAERAQEALAIAAPAAGRVLDVKRIERIARETAAELRRSEQVEAVTVLGEVDIRLGDFREVLSDIEPGSVDAIITDPPYPREYWPLYADLGALAHRVLKPSGVLAVMVGTRAEMVDEVDQMMRLHVCPRHRAVYLTPGQRWRDQTAFVATGYKPILIYSRIDADGLRWINDDIFTSSGTREQDTRYHHWGQTEAGFASLVERLTEPGHLVIDPFLGGGTTAVVCRDLGRRFIGCDIDAAHVATARERLA